MNVARKGDQKWVKIFQTRKTYSFPIKIFFQSNFCSILSLNSFAMYFYSIYWIILLWFLLLARHIINAMHIRTLVFFFFIAHSFIVRLQWHTNLNSVYQFIFYEHVSHSIRIYIVSSWQMLNVQNTPQTQKENNIMK